MSAEDMVDAALAGFDHGELITIPSLPDRAGLAGVRERAQDVGAGLSRSTPAPRYAVAHGAS